MLSKTIGFALCVNWSGSSSHVVKQVKQQITTNPNFVKQNGALIINHLCDVIEDSKWSSAFDFVKQVNTNTIDKWAPWEELASTIKQQLQHIHSLKPNQLTKCLQFLQLIRYQPTPNRDQIFYNILSNKIAQQDIKKIIQLAGYTLSVNPHIFKTHTKQLQQQIHKNIALNKSFESQFHKYAFIQGFMGDFWETDFILKIKQANLPDFSLQKYFQYADPSSPTSISQIEGKQNRTATQKKIGEMLLDLGYVFKQNVLINGIQVDFLIGNKIILEYNGMLHYRINNDNNEIIPIKYEYWRIRALEKRGFVVVSIPFFQWQKLQNERVQKQYLIDKVQTSLLASMGIPNTRK